MANVAKSVLLFGKCITSELKTAVRICVDKYEMDERLNMYFKEKKEVNAHDPKNECQEGDYVLISKLQEPENKNVDYIVEKIIYKRGNMIDPITGRKACGTEYVDDIMKVTGHFDCQKSFKKS